MTDLFLVIVRFAKVVADYTDLRLASLEKSIQTLAETRAKIKAISRTMTAVEDKPPPPRLSPMPAQRKEVHLPPTKVATKPLQFFNGMSMSGVCAQFSSLCTLLFSVPLCCQWSQNMKINSLCECRGCRVSGRRCPCRRRRSPRSRRSSSTVWDERVRSLSHRVPFFLRSPLTAQVVHVPLWLSRLGCRRNGRR